MPRGFLTLPLTAILTIPLVAADHIIEQPLAAPSAPRATTLFTELPPESTGIVTTNNYADPAMWGILNHEFDVGAIGTGVAIGDYDGDGKPDIFVVSKTESCRLFRNLGNWKFEDVTAKAGVEDQGDAAKIWKQGVTFADVNNDGLLDIYVCRFNAPNLLYINQGNGTFKEMAHAYGLDVKDASVMAAFCDYDRDGWLDVFIQTNVLDFNRHPLGQKNHLFHNNRDGTFTNVTDRAGITGEAQGHSATWWDFDNDGWPDLYVANDFSVADKLYRNNHDGTFTNVIDRVVPHTPFSSMGSDVGDINNDGLMDFLATDMAASTHEKDQRGMADSRSRTIESDGSVAVAPQYERNALYLNTGTGRCLEAAYLAGIAATDWTWSPRFEDLDNDGRLDLFVTNGMDREATNTDLLGRQMNAKNAMERIRVMRDSPILAETHFAFRNLGDLQFENVSAAWGLNQKGVSFGSAFGDLDGDGDLDLVYANYQHGVTVLRNDSDTGNRVIIDLRGVASNRFGVGATVKLESASGIQTRQLWLARGYLSSSEPTIHFGLGKDPVIARLTVNWPGGEKQTFTNLSVGRHFTITEPAAKAPNALDAPTSKSGSSYTEVGAALGLALIAREEAVDETAAQPLLPLRLNRRGPSLSVGRSSADGAELIALGGTRQDPMRILRRQSDGKFSAEPGPVTSAALNDGPTLFFDVNGDGRDDLLITKGGNTLPAGAEEYRARLFFQDETGHFAPAPDGVLPEIALNVGAVAAADFEHRGRLGLFIGGRVSTGQYPLPPPSVLLANRDGRLVDVTSSLAPGLDKGGMVTSAIWSDVDGDGWPDLLVTLEWGFVRYFHNKQGTGFEDWTERAGFAGAGKGWWTSIATADFNEDGQPDYVVGNAGLNSQYRATPDQPALVFYGNPNQADAEPVLIEAYHEGEKVFPWRSRRDLSSAVPAVSKRFPRNDYYARATLNEIFGADKLAACDRFEATELRSGVFLSQKDGTYRFSPLPRIAQIAPFQGLAAGYFDGDGHANIYALQNSYAPIPAVGRYDGGLSQLLKGDGRGHFLAVPVAESQLLVPGDAKALVVLDFDQDGWPDFLVSRNNTTTLAFRNQPIAGRHSLRVALHGSAGNPTAIGARITVELDDGSTQTSEVFAGSGYQSQSSSACFFGWRENNPPKLIHVRWPSGSVSSHPIPLGSAGVTLSQPAQ